MGQLQKIQELQTNDVKELLVHFLSGKSKETLLAYHFDLQDFSKFINSESITEALSKILPLDLFTFQKITLSYKNHLLALNLSPNTINRRLSSLRSIIKLARSFGLTMLQVEVPNLPSDLVSDTRGPEKSVVQKIVDYLGESNDPKSLRDLAIIRLFFDLGLRVSEIKNIDHEDIDFNLSTLKVLRKGKRQKITLDLPHQTLLALKNLSDSQNQKTGKMLKNFTRAPRGGEGMTYSGLTRQGIADIIKDLCRKVGAPKAYSPHKLRHSAITEACKEASKNGLGLEAVMPFSGHKNIQTLIRYRDQDEKAQLRVSQMVADQLKTKKG